MIFHIFSIEIVSILRINILKADKHSSIVIDTVVAIYNKGNNTLKIRIIINEKTVQVPRFHPITKHL